MTVMYRNLIKPFVNMIKRDKIRFSYQESYYNTQIPEKESSRWLLQHNVRRNTWQGMENEVLIKTNERKLFQKRNAEMFSAYESSFCHTESRGLENG
jgi:hypothetical protein